MSYELRHQKHELQHRKHELRVNQKQELRVTTLKARIVLPCLDLQESKLIMTKKTVYVAPEYMMR